MRARFVHALVVLVGALAAGAACSPEGDPPAPAIPQEYFSCVNKAGAPPVLTHVSASSLAADAVGIYWTTVSIVPNNPDTPYSAGVWALPFGDAGKADQIWDGNSAQDVVVDAARVYWRGGDGLYVAP